MERKLIKQGGGGYTIYLPKKWVNDKNLKEGENVTLLEKNSALIIQANTKTKNETTIKIDNSNRHDIRVLLTHAYRRGFDKITLEDVDSESFKEVKEAIKLLLGFDITTKHDKNCIIENISEPSDQKFEIIMNKLLLINHETLKTLYEDSKNRKFKIKELMETRDNHDKFLLFCRRILSKENISKSPTLIWEFLTFLQHIEHNSVYLYEYIAENNLKLVENTLSLLNELANYFDLFKSAFLNNDIANIHKINEERKKFQFGVCIKALEKGKGKENVVFSYIREIFRDIQLGTSPILSIILERD